MLECTHPKQEIRLRTLSNRTTAIYKQCVVCGEPTSNAISKNTTEGWDKLPVYDNDLREQYQSARHEKAVSVADQEREEMSAIERIRYNEYLCSPAWKGKRDAVMRRDRNLCQGCLTNKATEVHHTTYAHKYDEFLFELVAVCSPCHRRWHDIGQ